MKRFVLIVLLAAVWRLNNCPAQTIWSQRADAIGVKLEYLSPDAPTVPFEFGLTTQILTLDARFPIGRIVTVLLEAPMIFEKSDSPFRNTDNTNGLRNVFLGVEFGDMNSPVYAELGARPFMQENQDISGFGAYYGDFDRGEAYVREYTSFQAALNAASTQRGGFVYRVRVGPTIWVPKEGKNTTLIDYGAKLGFDNGTVSLYTALTGRWNTEESEESSGKTAFHHLGFDMGFRINKIRPALFYRVPLDHEISDFMKRTIGGSVSVEL